MTKPRRAVIGLGSNLGDRLAELDRATRLLAKIEGATLVERSPVYETAPVGGPPQGPFLNAAVLVQTALSARELLGLVLGVEAAMGRVRDGTRDAPRTIDLDLLWMEGAPVVEEDLEVPHPRLGERAFALVPLLEVAPDARGPDDKRYDARPAAGEMLTMIQPRTAGSLYVSSGG